MTWVWLGLLCYTIGSLPTAYLFTRYILGQDIRDLGDNNSGAANVFRNVGAKAGVAVGAVDIIKGALVIVLAKLLVDDTGMEMMAGGAALAGHNFPIHLKFRGGRGAATAIGVLITAVPLVGVPAGIIGLLLLMITHKAIFPLAVFLSAVPILTWPVYSWELGIYAVAIPLAVGLSHFFTTRILNPGAGSRS
ncbi:MAG: glycerol-3-phosphate acyltransferase [Dehalococcoidia bacterium]|nr:glycerol-3-phosphate acyltransferase [Dehalococcoidia bacterium]